MCLMSSPSPPPVPEMKEPPKRVDEGVQQARRDNKRKAAAAAGYSSTIATGPMGATGAPVTAMKTLLGQ